MFDFSAVDNYLSAFRTRLRAEGFERMSETKLETWRGSLTIQWKDPKSGQNRTAEHRLAIIFCSGFPYKEPTVVCEDTNPPIGRSWHLNPTDPPSLCLFQPETGWKPHFTAQTLLRQIHAWFVCYHTDTWPHNSVLPDLHLYLEQVGTIFVGEEWQPDREHESGPFTLWYQSDFARPAIASTIPSARRPESRLARFIGPSKSSGRDHRRAGGVWFRLPKAIVPPLTLASLLELIDEASGQPKGWARSRAIEILGATLKTRRLGFAFGYPDSTGIERWVFLWAMLPRRDARNTNWATLRVASQTPLKSFQTAPAQKSDLLRRSAHLSQHLVDKKIVIFGVGALGSPTALLLAKAGIGELCLVDRDIVMPGNPMRHICGMDLVGWPKTHGVKYVIEAHNIDCNVVPYDATWEIYKLLEVIEGCDLVIDTTANRSFSLHLSRVCIEKNSPLLIAAAQRRARVGRLMLRTRNNDPCLTCYYAGTWSIETYPIIPANPDETFVEDGCGGITEEATALDLEAIANQVARTAIKIVRHEELPGNLGFLVNEPLAEVTDGILSQVGMHWLHNHALTGCASCDAG